MTDFKFPLYARIARAENESPLLVVDRVVNVDTGKREYVIIDRCAIRDVGDAEEIEAEFQIVDEG